MQSPYVLNLDRIKTQGLYVLTILYIYIMCYKITNLILGFGFVKFDSCRILPAPDFSETLLLCYLATCSFCQMQGTRRLKRYLLTSKSVTNHVKTLKKGGFARYKLKNWLKNWRVSIFEKLKNSRVSKKSQFFI